MNLDGRVALITAAEESVVPSLVPSFEKAPTLSFRPGYDGYGCA